MMAFNIVQTFLNLLCHKPQIGYPDRVSDPSKLTLSEILEIKQKKELAVLLKVRFCYPQLFLLTCVIRMMLRRYPHVPNTHTLQHRYILDTKRVAYVAMRVRSMRGAGTGRICQAQKYYVIYLHHETVPTLFTSCRVVWIRHRQELANTPLRHSSPHAHVNTTTLRGWGCFVGCRILEYGFRGVAQSDGSRRWDKFLYRKQTTVFWFHVRGQKWLPVKSGYKRRGGSGSFLKSVNAAISEYPSSLSDHKTIVKLFAIHKTVIKSKWKRVARLCGKIK